MRNYVLVAIGGGIGSVLRFKMGEWLAPFHPWQPFPTLLINLSGCFIISLLHFVSDPTGRVYLGPRSRLFLLVGFCGGYTTFSTFSLFSLEAMTRQNWFDLWANILLSHVLCLMATLAGYAASTPIALSLAKVSRKIRRIQISRGRD